MVGIRVGIGVGLVVATREGVTVGRIVVVRVGFSVGVVVCLIDGASVELLLAGAAIGAEVGRAVCATVFPSEGIGRDEGELDEN